MLSLFQFRRKNPGQVFAWATYDFANSTFATTILAVIFNNYYAGVVAGGIEGVQFLGKQVPGATMFTIFVSSSILLIALAGPILSAISDLGKLKKQMLILHLLVGASATLALAGISEGMWLAGGLIFLVAQFGFAGGNIFYNAMMYDVADEEDFGKVSAIGWAFGYIGGGILLAINLVMLQYPHLIGFTEGAFSVHDCFISVAIWWLLFSIPIVFFVHPSQRGKSTSVSLRKALKTLRGTLKHLRELPHFARFFFAFLLYNDGIETVIVMASIFGAQELGMSNANLIIFFLMIQAIAFLGSLAFGYLTEWLGNKRAILLSLIIWMAISIWAWQIGLFGNALKEYWFLGIVAAIVLGGSQAASRSLQAMLIPPRRAAEFFSFFAISGKFASAAGPLIFGAAVFMTGSLRLGVLSLLVLFIGGFFILLSVNENEGRKQALAFSENA